MTNRNAVLVMGGVAISAFFLGRTSTPLKTEPVMASAGGVAVAKSDAPANTAATPATGGGDGGRPDGYTVVPTALLASVNVTIVGEGRKVSPRWAVIGGLTPEKVNELNVLIDRVDRDLHALRKANTRMVRAGNGFAIVETQPFPDAGVKLRDELLKTVENQLQPDVAKYVMPLASKRLDAQFGYFGAYRERIEVRRRAQSSPQQPEFVANRTVLFGDSARTQETTAMNLREADLEEIFPGLAL